MACSHQKNEQMRVGKPKWLRRSLPTGPEYEKIRTLLKGSGLTTVCQEAQCPNQFECYSKGTATFMIMGDHCTRNCRFCAVAHGPKALPDEDEAERVADAVSLLGLRYAVITSVTRDDLADGGASCFVRVIEAIRKKNPKTLIEVLIPDLAGNWGALQTILDARPDVLNHNIETVPRLYSVARPGAEYRRSLELLREVRRRAPQMVTKTGMMLGLGEETEELYATWQDLRESDCDILTMGQYLQPTVDHLLVQRFVEPTEFDRLGDVALAKDFLAVASGPFVRSSYEAEKLFRKAELARK
ncbi:lipoyl synthase [Desulfotalea psychrophila]|uniref:Lipoyl synthase n=1 Tax=Desulfotalea psychrophila (strain LSv54 / DSM 12343) TaxID=177439 RepID=LIPA_DESPS|nr:lipoyl synthase [Desulfotalea psychrophila]Q6ARK0.1 RecName: Full=Lipoyl synthase; AltName: Full=Lip-syn; Short=LS; AltName: Full=Lipoate synthase; AltName: Full=Lipoic acid synthase; AltName: Full=Sulfur insertion protein LipA [Desulfotalea psychrophila LSv54]CAG35025.1 probable lipoic acid synthetase (LipA) [Desulfotalea psychrophila LSv54]